MSPKVLGLFLYVGLAVFGNYVVIVVSSYKTLRVLKEIGAESASFAAINRQLNYIFALQVRHKHRCYPFQKERKPFRQQLPSYFSLVHC